jgi:hypothetical protein
LTARSVNRSNTALTTPPPLRRRGAGLALALAAGRGSGSGSGSWCASTIALPNPAAAPHRPAGAASIRAAPPWPTVRTDDDEEVEQQHTSIATGRANNNNKRIGPRNESNALCFA